MAYSMDLRQRVVNYVLQAESAVEVAVQKASKRYEVSRATIYRWLARKDLQPTVVKRRQRKLDDAALTQHVRDYPDARLKDRAAHFGVHTSAIGFTLKRLKITRKKNNCDTVSATPSNGKPF